MQHSLKFVLSDSTSYARVSAAFPESVSNPLVLMEDSFLDTDDRLLSRNNIMLRVRRYVAARTASNKVGADASKHPNQGMAPYAEVRAMQHSTVTDGCAQRWDTSAPLDPKVAEKIYLLQPIVNGNNNTLQDPLVVGELLDRLLESCGGFLEKIVAEATNQPSPKLRKFVKLGGYRTLRDTRPWDKCNAQPGLKLRIDHTTYSFGERYEVEVADISVPVQDVVEELSAELEQIGARFMLGHETKWQVMMAAKKAANVKNHMAVAAKIELQTADDFETVRRSLGGLPAESENDEPFGELQDNYFFDTIDHQLRRRNIVFRLRILPNAKGGKKAFVTIKENEPVTGGSAVSWMQEESIPVEVVENTLQDPTSFFLHPSSAAEKLQSLLMGASVESVMGSQYMLGAANNSSSQNNNGSNSSSSQPQQQQLSQRSNNANVATPSKSQQQQAKPGSCVPTQDNFPNLVFAGGYTNRRESFVWPSCQSQPGLTINLDRTKYPFGERFEIEVPGITVPVHDVVSELGEILSSLDVRFRPATADKMQIMLNGMNKSRQTGIPPSIYEQYQRYGNLYGYEQNNNNNNGSFNQRNVQQTSQNNYYNGPQRVLDGNFGRNQNNNNNRNNNFDGEDEENETNLF